MENLSTRQKLGLIVIRPIDWLLYLTCNIFDLAINLDVGVMVEKKVNKELLEKIKKAIDNSFDNNYPRA